MKKNEVIDLLQDIEIFYPGKFKIESARIVEVWQKALADQDAETVHENLLTYTKREAWPPGISDLVEVEQHGSGPAVPTAEQTKKYLQGLDNRQKLVQEEIELHGNEEIEQAKANIRRILGMDGVAK